MVKMERPDLDAIERRINSGAGDDYCTFEDSTALIAYARHLEAQRKAEQGAYEFSLDEHRKRITSQSERITELESALEPLGALLKRPGMYVGPDSPWVGLLQHLGEVLRKGTQP